MTIATPNTDILRRFFIFLGALILVMSLSASCPPYKLPEIPGIENYANKVYIDPSRSTNGNGTLSNPYNTVAGISSNLNMPANTAYLIRRGTVLNERINKRFVNSYIGAYGEGAKPIITQGLRLNAYNSTASSYVVVNDLEIRSESMSTGGNDAVVFVDHVGLSPQPHHIIISNNIITGIYNPNKFYKYPYRAIKSSGNDYIFFNNVISYVYDDGIQIGSGNNIQIVRNYIHNVDMKRVGNQYTDRAAGELTDGSEFNLNCGDNLHLNHHSNLYIAGNYLDRTATSWKFALIIKTDFTGPRSGGVIEYNTFIGNNGGPGGGAILFIRGPRDSSIRYNLIDPTNGGVQNGTYPFVDAASGQIALQKRPYGVYDNAFVRRKTGGPVYSPATLNDMVEADNEVFNTFAGYASWKKSTNNNWGSDIDPKNFWVNLDCNPTKYNFNFDIKNQQGNAITNATVTFAGITNPQGNYSFPNISSGHYNLSVTAPGYMNFTQTNVQVNQNKTHNVVMQAVPSEPDFIVQSASGTSTASFSKPATAGNLLVAVLAHRSDPISSPKIPAGFTLREVIQFKETNQDRHGILICDKIADGTETTFNLGFGAANNNGVDLGGIIMEFEVENPVFYQANKNTSGITQPASFNINVPNPNLKHLSVAAAVSRNAGALTGWNNGFVSPVASVPQVGAAARMNTTLDLPGSLTLQNSGEQGAVIAASWTIGSAPAPTYQLTTSVTGSGTVAVSPQKVNYAKDEQVQLTATAAQGWKFANWQGAITHSTNPTTLVMNANKALTAVFQPVTYNVTASALPSNGGNIIGAGTFNHGQSATLTATAAAGYNFVNWTENGNVVSTNPQLTFEVTSNRSFHANYSAIGILNAVFNVRNTNNNPVTNATITFAGITNSPGNYTFSGIAPGTYSYTVKADGYQVANAENINITQDTNIPVVLTPNTAQTYWLAFQVKDANTQGLIWDAKITLNGKTHLAGEYFFEDLSAGSQTYSISAPGYQPLASQTINLSSNQELIAVLTPSDSQSFLIDGEVNPAGYAIIKGAGEYQEDDEVSLTATALDNQFIFIGWMENDVIISSDNPLKFNAKNNRNIVAHFSYIPHALRLTIDASVAGSAIITGAGHYVRGETAVLEVTPNPGFTFVGWMGNNGQITSRRNPYNLKINRDTHLVAVMDSSPSYMEDVSLRIFPNPSSGLFYIENSRFDNARLEVFNAVGVVVEEKIISNHSNTIDLSNLPTGMYILRFQSETDSEVRKVYIKR